MTLYVEVGSGADGGHAAAAEHRLALVESRVAHHRAQHGQAAVVVAQTAGDQHPVLPPGDAQLDQRSGEGETRCVIPPGCGTAWACGGLV